MFKQLGPSDDQVFPSQQAVRQLPPHPPLKNHPLRAVSSHKWSRLLCRHLYPTLVVTNYFHPRRLCCLQPHHRRL